MENQNLACIQKHLMAWKKLGVTVSDYQFIDSLLIIEITENKDGSRYFVGAVYNTLTEDYFDASTRHESFNEALLFAIALRSDMNSTAALYYVDFSVAMLNTNSAKQ